LNILLIPIGSAGDVHPFVGLGLALRRRGHAVRVITNAHFESLIRRVGLNYDELGTRQHAQAIEDPDLWHPIKGFVLLTRSVLPLVPLVYEAIQARYQVGDTVVVASTLAFGARVAQERLGINLATVHLQPAVFRSEFQAPVLPGMLMPDWAPRLWKRLLYRFGDALIVDRLLAPGLNSFRAKLGLPAVRHLFDRWWHSPQRVIGLFPPWYAAPQPDWPPQTRLTGFPLYDERGVEPVPAEVSAFLDGGEPPVVFTPGSAMQHGRDFFAASVAACRLLGRRGLLLTRFREQVPAGLPDGVRHFDYIPFSVVLPRAAAVVHHGGIGTSAQGLAAGIPQLVMPMGFDQLDNAARLVRLGVGQLLRPGAYRGQAVAAALRRLLEAPAVAERCRAVAGQFGHGKPLEETCDLIEELAQHERSTHGRQENPDARRRLRGRL
jgi:rhamnosyltransferase subunit B